MIIALGLSALLACQGPEGPSAPWSGARPPLGKTGVGLVVAGLGAVDEVTYRISHPSGFERAGSIPLRTEQGGYSAFFGLPAADGYRLWLQARTPEGELCEGSTTFDIHVDEKVSAQVLMHCPDPEAVGVGSVELAGRLNVCPVLRSVVGSADRARIGGAIELRATATDGDGAPSPVSYAWKASGGALSQLGSASTSLTCLAEEWIDMQLEISDGDPACMSKLSFVLGCVGAESAVTAPSVTLADAGLADEPIGEPEPVFDAGLPP